MIIRLYKGYPDRVGRRLVFAGSGIGPASYSQATGDVIQPFAFQNYIDSIDSGIQSVSGTFVAYARPSAAGPRQTWSLHYFVVSTGAEVANAVNLSAETFVVSGFGGTY